MDPPREEGGDEEGEEEGEEEEEDVYEEDDAYPAIFEDLPQGPLSVSVDAVQRVADAEAEAVQAPPAMVVVDVDEEDTEGEDDPEEVAYAHIIKNEKEMRREGEASAKSEGVESDRSSSPNCPICLEMWRAEGPHRVCCIPCGHVYGRSCLERWLARFGKKSGKCPQCSRNYKRKDIINLYAPLVVVPNDYLEKEVHSLREKNESLKLEKAQLLEEINQQKKRARDRENSLLQHDSSGLARKKFFVNSDSDQLCTSSFGSLMANNSESQGLSDGRFCHCSFVLQNEIAVDGARVMGIDASSQIVVVARKACGLERDHVLSKISLLNPYGVDDIHLPSNTRAIRDLCILPNGLALAASLGKKLLLLSMASNNLVLKYDLPAPAWSCSGDDINPYNIYAGLQNGLLLVFDIRQTAEPVHAIYGLTRHPIHSVHSVLLNNGGRKALIASSIGPCLLEVDSSGKRPYLIPGMENEGVCISLAFSSSHDDIVASYRPKVEFPNCNTYSQTSVSPSPPLSSLGKIGSHFLIKRVNNASFQRHGVCSSNVSDHRMSKSAIICMEGNNAMFAHGDESSHALRLWHLPSLQQYTYLKPLQYPILDVRYERGSTGPGFLGCISEDRLQVFSCC